MTVFVLYNIAQLIFLSLFSPLILIFVLLTPKYRSRIPARLGYGLGKKFSGGDWNTKEGTLTFWVHALSIGEVTSAIPLVTGLREHYPDCKIVFSVTTRSGRQVADRLLPGLVDRIIDGPLDILPVVYLFLKTIQPSYFILVETDFWPNILLLLKKRRIPTLLVNGRVSDKALLGYRRMDFFFKPIFTSLSALCMQTEADKRKMISLGLDLDKLHTLGNLKFDTKNSLRDGNHSIARSIKKQLPRDKIVFIAGSTHPGEEEVLLDAFLDLKKIEPHFFLVIAPRDTSRAAEIKSIATRLGLTVSMRSEAVQTEADMFILNTIGELSACYSLGDISFVGGSLVKKGGHNPIEPAVMSTPVLFGPHMEDFSEIARSLIHTGGAHEVRNSQEMSATLKELVAMPETRFNRGLAAKNFVDNQRGVIARHLQLIHNHL